MRTKFCLIVAGGILFASCSKNGSSNPQNIEVVSATSLTYRQSFDKWLSYKNSVHDNYTYTVETSSFTGFSTETKLAVKNGVVVSRDYTAYNQMANSTNNAIVNAIAKQWHESGTSLNTHNNEGSRVLTLDEVYSIAATVWLKANPKTNDIYFETKNDGVISVCGFFPLGCQDDCFTGINISAIKAL
ncbi:MAG: hypothetical protein ACXVB0_15440 [Mucilaginibacter sp.]